MDEEMIEAIRSAYMAGAKEVHEWWANADGEERAYATRDEHPDFTEAAYDYAAAHSVIAGQIADLEGALIKARDKFRHYAIQHEAKARAANPGGSERSMSGEAADRWAKAQSNREMAEMCDAALAQTKGTDR